MILKKFKRTNLSRTKRSMIGGLVDYILASEDEHGNKKCAWSFAENFIAATRKGQRAEMIALAEESIKSRMPAAHWMMSWNENEIPDERQIRQAVDMFLQGMGLEGHQVIVAVHTNTQNIHAHIVVNRVNPDTLKVIQPHNGFDIEAAHKIVAQIEKVQGWQPQKHARYRVDENNQIVRNTPRKSQPPSARAQDFENFAGEKSAQRIARKLAYKVIENAQSWQELHQELGKAGLRFERKGSGAIIFVGETAVKASSIDRKFSLGKLCKRLGEFQPEQYPEILPTINPEPIWPNARKEWEEYRSLRKTALEEQKQKRELAKQEKADKLKEILAKQAEHREQACSQIAVHGLPLLNIARYCLKIQHKAELAEVKKELEIAPRLIFPRFRDWLRQQKPWLAEIWRLRRLLEPGKQYQPHREGTFPKVGRIPKPFLPFLEMVKRRYADMRLAKSRLDAATALHLRFAGYSRKNVEEEMQRHSPAPANPADLAQNLDYRRRILDYAFGAQGDIIVTECGLTPEMIEKFNSEAELVYFNMRREQDLASHQLLGTQARTRLR